MEQKAYGINVFRGGDPGGGGGGDTPPSIFFLGGIVPPENLKRCKKMFSKY